MGSINNLDEGINFGSNCVITLREALSIHFTFFVGTGPPFGFCAIVTWVKNIQDANTKNTFFMNPQICMFNYIGYHHKFALSNIVNGCLFKILSWDCDREETLFFSKNSLKN